MTKKTICILTPRHFSSNMGGAEYQSKLLVEALVSSEKYEIFYLCHRSNPEFDAKGYQIRTIGDGAPLGRYQTLSIAKNIYSELSMIQPEILYQNVGGVQTGVAAFYAKKKNIKFIWHIASDDDIITQWKSNLTRVVRLIPERIFLNYGIKNSDIIAAQTQYQADLLKKKRGIVCSNFIPIGHPLPEDNTDKPDKISVLWIANMKPLKRPEVFVRLAKYFTHRNDVHFTMVGAPGWGKWFKKLLIEINTMSNVRYLGQTTQSEVNALLSKSHLLVNTSRYEGFSNTFVQAWMREVPVISLSVDPDGILVKQKIGYKSNTFSQLCKDITTLIESKKLREDMGKRAFVYAAENHTVEKMVNSAIRLFD